MKHTNNKTGICPAVGNTAEGVWGERERERDKNCTPVVRETQRISRILFFCFRPPFSHHSHTNGVNKAFFPSGATTYAAVLALRPGTEPCDHHHVSLKTRTAGHWWGPKFINFINAPIAQVDIIDEHLFLLLLLLVFFDTHIHSFHRIMTIDLDHHSTLVSTKTTRIMKSEKRVECPKEGPVYAATRGGNVEDLRDMARMGKRFVQTTYSS